MDMDFTPEQELLRDSVRRTCERHGGLDAVRKLENDPLGYSPALWTQLAELGVLGVMIDEEYGGSGMTMVDAAVIYEELGRALVPSPHFVSCDPRRRHDRPVRRRLAQERGSCRRSRVASRS